MLVKVLIKFGDYHPAIRMSMGFMLVFRHFEFQHIVPPQMWR